MIWAPITGPPESQAPLLADQVTATITGPSFAVTAPDGHRLEVTADPSLLQLCRWWDGTDQGRYTLEWMHRNQQLVTGSAWTGRVQVGRMPPG